MQSFKWKPVFRLVAVDRNFARTVAVNTFPATHAEPVKSFRDIPSPSRLPIIGQLHHFLPGGDLKFTSALDLGLKLYEKFGPIVRIDGLLGMPDSLILFDPESSAQILRSENLGMPVRPGFKTLDYYRKNKNGKDVTNGLLTDHGEIWKKFRSTVNPVLLQPKTIKLYSGMLDSVAKDMVTSLVKIYSRMQTAKVKRVLYLATENKNLIRTLAANPSPAINTEQLKPYDEIPAPSRLPIIGQIHHFLTGGEFKLDSALEFGLKLYEKYGPIVKFDGKFGMNDFIFLFDPESSAQILRSENMGTPIRPGFQSLDYYRQNKNGIENPNGLLTDNGEMWKKFRTTVNPVMLQSKTIRLYNTKLDEVARDMISRMRSIRGENGMLQRKFDTEMNLWSLESIGLVALGRRLNCFDSNLPPDSPEMKLIQLVHDIFKIANDLDFKPNLWKYYPTKTFKRAMKLYEEQANIAKYFVDKTIEELTVRGDQKSDDEKGVLEKLLEINKDYAVIMACDMLFAGVDTTSNTITATLYHLAKNQDKQDKLREEVTSPREKRPYLRACIKESIRVMPVAGGNARKTTKDYAVLGYHIPKGTQISFMHQTMSMLEEYYPRPTEYIPERWITSKDDPLYHGNAHPFAYGPFGFGVRSCIGRRIAELEMEIFLTRIIQNFKVEWSGPPPKVTSSSLNYVTGPFNFVFKDV